MTDHQIVTLDLTTLSTEQLLALAQVVAPAAPATVTAPAPAPTDAPRSFTANEITVTLPEPERGDWDLELPRGDYRTDYNRALSRAGLPTIGGAPSYRRLLTLHNALWATTQGVSVSPEALSEIARAQTAAPKEGTVRAKIAAAKAAGPKARTHTWTKADGTIIPCTQAQFESWTAKRATAKAKAVQAPPAKTAEQADAQTLLAQLVALLGQA